MGSRRLPGKALADIAGLPMVVHVWRRVAGSGLFDRVVVGADDERIVQAVLQRGGEAVITGPAPSGSHRVAEVARRLGREDVVNVQGDQPLVSVEALAAVVRGLERAAVATVAAPLEGDASDPALVKVTVDAGLAGDFSRSPLGGALHHVGIYGFARGSLERAVSAPRSLRADREDLEQLAWMDAGLSIAVEGISFAQEGIDTALQLDRLRARFDAGLETLPDLPRPSLYGWSGLR